MQMDLRTFSGRVDIGGDISTTSAVRIYDTGNIYIRSNNTDTAKSIFKYFNQGYTDNDVKIDFKTNGSATFAADVNVGNRNPGSSSSAGTRIANESGVSGVYTQSNSSVNQSSIAFQALRGTDEIFKVSYDGSATFAGSIQSAGNPDDGGANGFKVSNGKITATRDSTADLFLGYTKGNSTPTSTIAADGSASFANIDYKAYTNSNRPSHDDGKVIYNSEEGSLQLSHDGEWTSVGSGGDEAPPIVNSVVVSRTSGPSAARFTSSNFNVTTNMGNDIPTSSKGLKGKVIADFFTYPEYSGLDSAATDTENAPLGETTPGSQAWPTYAEVTWPENTFQNWPSVMNFYTGTSGDNFSMVSNWINHLDNKPRIVTGIVIGDSWFHVYNRDQLDQSGVSVGSTTVGSFSESGAQRFVGLYNQTQYQKNLSKKYWLTHKQNLNGQEVPKAFCLMWSCLDGTYWSSNAQYPTTETLGLPDNWGLRDVAFWENENLWVFLYCRDTVVCVDGDADFDPINWVNTFGSTNANPVTGTAGVVSVFTIKSQDINSDGTFQIHNLTDGRLMITSRAATSGAAYLYLDNRQEVINYDGMYGASGVPIDGTFSMGGSADIRSVFIHKHWVFFQNHQDTTYRFNTQTNSSNVFQVNDGNVRWNIREYDNGALVSCPVSCNYAGKFYTDGVFISYDDGTTWIPWLQTYNIGRLENQRLLPTVAGNYNYVSAQPANGGKQLLRSCVKRTQTLTLPSGTDFSGLTIGTYLIEKGKDTRNMYNFIRVNEVDAPNRTITVGTSDALSAGDVLQQLTPTGTATSALYLVIDSVGNVTDLSSSDPGFVDQGSGTGPLNFPATFPSGSTPDEELPPGTSLQVEVQATNELGSSTKLSSPITPN